MRIIKKFFKLIITIIIVPTFIIIGIILWSHATGKNIQLPVFLQNLTGESASNNFLLDARIQTADVYEKGSSVPVGIRGYIEVSNADLSAMTPSQYLEFYQTVLKGSEYKWFSVICPDNTGLFIPDCEDGAACFCSLNDLGRQAEIYGYLMIRDNTCIYEEAVPATN